MSIIMSDAKVSKKICLHEFFHKLFCYNFWLLRGLTDNRSLFDRNSSKKMGKRTMSLPHYHILCKEKHPFKKNVYPLLGFSN